MEEKKEKKKVDMVVVLSVIFVTAVICIFNSWLYFDGKIDKIKKSNEVMSMMLKSRLEDLSNEKNDLQLAFDKFKSDIQDAQEKNK